MSAFTIICILVLSPLIFILLMFYLMDEDFRKFVNYSLISKYNYLEMKNISRHIPVCTDCHKMEMEFKKTKTVTVDESDKTFYVFECPRCKGTKILGKKGYNEYQKEKNKREYDKKQKDEYNALFRLQPMGHVDWSNFGNNISSSIRKSAMAQAERMKMFMELQEKYGETIFQKTEDGKTNSSV